MQNRNQTCTFKHAFDASILIAKFEDEFATIDSYKDGNKRYYVFSIWCNEEQIEHINKFLSCYTTNSLLTDNGMMYIVECEDCTLNYTIKLQNLGCKTLYTVTVIKENK